MRRLSGQQSLQDVQCSDGLTPLHYAAVLVNNNCVTTASKMFWCVIASVVIIPQELNEDMFVRRCIYQCMMQKISIFLEQSV